MNHIFIDGSYYIFYRYHALKVWWRNAKQEDLDDPFENEEFLEKFKSTFISKINEIPKKIKVSDYKKGNFKIYVGKDCPRKEIWRMKLHDKYKGNRDGEEGSVAEKEGKIIKKFFKYVYDNNLFNQANVSLILKMNNLEADDCIALYIKNLLKYDNNDKNIKYFEENFGYIKNTNNDLDTPKIHETKNKDNVYIITSDADYLQLVDENITIYNLKFKNIALGKNCFQDKNKNLFYKIVMGDKSDNIPPIFPRCGIKTIEKYFNDKDLFGKKKNEKEEYQKQYLLNTRLISFNCIPIELQESFKNLYF